MFSRPMLTYILAEMSTSYLKNNAFFQNEFTLYTNVYLLPVEHDVFCCQEKKQDI